MIVDFHTHIFPPSFRQKREALIQQDATFEALMGGPKAKMATAEELVGNMETQGIDLSVVMGFGWCNFAVAQEANDYLLEAASRFPNKLVPFCSINPLWGEPAVQEAERCVRSGARGIGELHPDTQGYDIRDTSLMAPLMKVAQAHGLVVLTHSSEPVGHLYPGKGRTTPEMLLPFVKAFPKVSIVCAHWGGGLPFYTLMPEVQRETSHVYFDTAASPFLYRREIFPVAIELVGARRILFASDYPLLQPQRVVQQIEAAVADPQARQQILGGNALRLLKLPSA